MTAVRVAGLQRVYICLVLASVRMGDGVMVFVCVRGVGKNNRIGYRGA